MSDSSVLLIPILLCLCFGGLLVAVFAGIYFFINRSVRGVNRTWGDLGMTTGLTLKPAAMFSQPELNGKFRQRPIRVYTYSSGTQRYRTTFTSVALSINNPNNSVLEITPAGTVGNFFGKMIKAQDAEIGNPAFDARFVIKSDPQDSALKVLGNPKVQNELLDIPDVFRIELEGSSLKYSKRGLEDNAEYLKKLFNSLSDLADWIERT